jgi:hypothetical protein
MMFWNPGFRPPCDPAAGTVTTLTGTPQLPPQRLSSRGRIGNSAHAWPGERIHAKVVLREAGPFGGCGSAGVALDQTAVYGLEGVDGPPIVQPDDTRRHDRGAWRSQVLS